MDEELRREVEALARRILVRYFCEADVEFLISTFAPDIVWLGGGEHQRAQGREAVAACFRAGKDELFPCDMTREHYVTAQMAPGCYLCQGDSWLTSKPGLERYFNGNQRVSFVFRRARDGSLQTAHIHNSISFADLLEGELFPVHATQAAYRRLEQVLQQRDSQIELMLSQLPGGMLICRNDADFSIEWISDSLCALLGYRDAAQFAARTGNTCRGFILEEDFAPMRLQVNGTLGAGETYSVEYRARRSDGALFWVSDIGKLVGEDGGETMLYAFISDITGRKQRELEMLEAKRETERKARFLTQLYNTVPCGTLQFTTDPAHAVVSVNRMVWEFYGFESEAAYRAAVRTPFQQVLDRDRARIQALVDGLTLDGGTVSYTRESARRDGTPAWVSVVMSRLINADGREVIQAVFTDCTDMHDLQAAREQERLLENRSLRAAICTAYPLIMSVNLTRNTYSCFIEEQQIYGVPRTGSYDALLAQSVQRCAPACRAELRAAMDRARALERFAGGEREIYLELRQLGVDGNYHWISLHLIYVENPFSGDVMAIRLLKVLDAQRAEQLRQEQLLRDALASANEANRAYLLSLINDILDMSKIETGKMTLTREPFRLRTLLEELDAILLPQARALGIALETTLDVPPEQSYLGDPLRLKQILMNLLSNALKFTPPGGRVELTLRQEPQPDGLARLRIRVADTGIGMSQAFMGRIFQPFEQESPESARNNVGSGLGLSIVYNLVQLMGGTIRAESVKGEGSRFLLSLPLELAEEARAPARQTPAAGRADLTGARVLLVEDNALNLEIARSLLELNGLLVETAENGALAVERFSAAPEGHFLAVLMDIRMPVMDGLAATRAIRALARPDAGTVPILAMTANAFEEDRQLAAQAGMSGYLVKPLDTELLLRTLEGLLEQTDSEHRT